MDITERLNQWAENDLRAEAVALEARDEIETLRKLNYELATVGARHRTQAAAFNAGLRAIADIEFEDIPAPKTAAEGNLWTILAMCVGLAERVLEGELGNGYR